MTVSHERLGGLLATVAIRFLGSRRFDRSSFSKCDETWKPKIAIIALCDHEQARMFYDDLMDTKKERRS